MSNPPRTPPSPEHSRTPWFVQLLIAVGVLFLLALVLVVPLENWRGKRAWEQCRRELTSSGEDLDWTNYIPPPVPDDQNIFKAPHISDWFVGQANHQFEQLFDSTNFPQFLAKDYPPSIIADLTFVPLDYKFNRNDADLLLRYDPPVLSLWTNSTAGTSDRDAIISLSNVPLPKAIDILAHEANLKYALRPSLDSSDFDRTNMVTCRWTNATAEQVLFFLLNKYNLGWRENPKTGVLFITERPSTWDRAYADPQTRVAIRKILEKTILTGVTNAQNPHLTGPAGLSFVAKGLDSTNRANFIVQTSDRAASAQLTRFFTNASVGGSNRLSLITDFPDAHSVSIVTESPCPAAAYLRWSDQFEPQFTAIREALRRPYARRDGSYTPVQPPMPTFIAIRTLARVLAQRAQCDLLLGKPEDALRELTLLHELRRLSDGDPAHKYGSIISAMINVAVDHMYTGVVADGLQLHAWHDSQLVAIQKQLAELNLCALLITSLRCERAAMESVIETTYQSTTNKLAQNVPLLRKSPLPITGWFYQNQVAIARLDQEIIDGYDPTNDLIRIDLVNKFEEDKHRVTDHIRPYTLIASIVVPEGSKALARAASEQTALNQARIACALERYRIAQGNLPGTLDALAPQFIENLPHDIMNGQPLKYQRSTYERFQLYSVGWNQTDDGGITATNLNQGDWVWPPAK